MATVKFYDEAADELLEFAVIIAVHNGKCVFCKHKDRNTLEAPGGHREPREKIDDTAARELYEETGALAYDIEPVCVYSVTVPERSGRQESFGMLYYADIRTFEGELHSEIEKILLMEDLPSDWTYPEIQPKLLEKVKLQLTSRFSFGSPATM